jgi:hypothetical protein
MNELEKAIIAGEVQVDLYLDDVSTKDFIRDIEDIKSKYSDKGAIQQAIDKLKELLP